MELDYSKMIKLLRAKLNISQTELGNNLGVSYSSINRWENKKHRPTIIAKVKLEELFKKNKIENIYR